MIFALEEVHSAGRIGEHFCEMGWFGARPEGVIHAFRGGGGDLGKKKMNDAIKNGGGRSSSPLLS